MRTPLRFVGVAFVLLLAVAPSHANDVEQVPEKGVLPLKVREYIASKYFDDVDPEDQRITDSVEVLSVPEAILKHVRENE